MIGHELRRSDLGWTMNDADGGVLPIKAADLAESLAEPSRTRGKIHVA